MSFIYPQFLWAFLLLAIPVLIHLFNFRRYKTVYFSQVSFLKEVKQETKKQSQLKHLLVLIARILAFTALILAFAQPYFQEDNNKIQQTKSTISIYVDNSFSMQNNYQEGNKFEVARQFAYEIVKSFNKNDQFQILSNEFEGFQQRVYTQNEALKLIDQLVLSPETRTFTEVNKRQNSTLSKYSGTKREQFVISDFQKSTFNLDNFIPDSANQYWLIPLTSENQHNVSIDSVWIIEPAFKPNDVVNIHYRLKNYSSKKMSIPLKASLENQVINQAEIDIQPFEKKDSSIAVVFPKKGIHYGKISLGNDAIKYDNTFHFGVKLADVIEVAIIQPNVKDSSVKSVFEKDSIFNVSVFKKDQIDQKELENADLIILNGAQKINSGLISTIERAISNGRSLFVFPPAQQPEKLNTLLSTFKAPQLSKKDTNRIQITKLTFKHPFFSSILNSETKNPLLPTSFLHYVQLPSNGLTQNLLEFENNEVALSITQYKKGTIYLSSSPIQEKYSTWTKHSLLLPILFQSAFNSQSKYPLAYTIGSNQNLIAKEKPNPKETFEIYSGSGKNSFIPSYKTIGQLSNIRPGLYAENEGNYVLKLNDRSIAPIALNYNRLESNQDQLSETDLNEFIDKTKHKNLSIITGQFTDVASQINLLGDVQSWWKLLIIGGLIFLGIETLLIRLWK